MLLRPSHAVFRLLPCTGISLLALTAALQAQQVVNEPVQLSMIHLIAEGADNVEATGGTEITAEDLARIQPANISDLFSRESTVTVSGGGGAAKKVSVLGVEQSLLAVTVDGVPQGATSWHHTGSNVVDPAFLKAVKVEAGAAAADSGFGAAAGSLRYETMGVDELLEDGQSMGGRATLAYGDNGRGTAGSLAGYGRHGAFDWFLMGNTASGKNYKDGSGRETLGTEPGARNVLGKFGVEAEGHRLELGIESSRDDADRLIKANLTQAGEAVHPLKVSRNSIKLSYSSTAPTELWDPQASLYFSQYEYWRPNYATGARGNNGDAIFNEEQFGGKIQNTFSLGYGKITAGIDFNQHDYATDNYGDGQGRDRRYRNFSTSQIGIFAQGRFEFDNGFNLSSGARLDAHRFEDWNGQRFSDSGSSLNATLSYRVNDNVEVFAGASHTWLGYVVGDYGYVHARNNAFVVDPNIKPGEAENYKLGANFGGDNWQSGVTFFDTKIDRLFDYDGTAMVTNRKVQYRSKGVTLDGRYDFGATQIGASFTKADVTADGTAVTPTNGTYLMPVGELATVYIDHQLPNLNTKIGASLEWAGKVDAQRTATHIFPQQEDYTVVNAYAEWTPESYKGLNLRLSVDNLLDEKYSERSGFATRTDLAGGSVLDPVWAPGRTIALNIAYKF